VGEIAFVNQAAEPIQRATVKVCDQTLTFTNLAPREVAHATYRVNCEGHQDADVVFQSGRSLHAELGYVTGGIDRTFHELLVTEAEITVGRTEIK